ncbi:hypothetical protein K2Q08_00680 [Patescibacteria group bacterium]|nr:hypothetical protein [Patescibacteria group bacterium]
MNDILQANIFFFISSVSTILIAALLAVILFYIARIMRDISDVVRKINNVSSDIERDFQDLRHEIKNEGVKVRSIIDVALGFFLSRVQKRATRKPKPSTETEPTEEVQ